MTTENIEASEQRFSAAISDFFGITEGGEIKTKPFTQNLLLKNLQNYISSHCTCAL